MSRPAYRARDIAEVFETIAPIASGIVGDELGFIHGDPDRPVTGLACLWQANTRSIGRAAEVGANLLLCHETLWLPHQNSQWYTCPAADQIRSNQLRRELLDRHGMTVYRSHSNWDALPDDGVPDQAVAALGLRALDVVASQRFFKVHRLPAAVPVETLARRAEAGLGFAGVRVFGDRRKPIRQFAFLIGGFGENQWHMPQQAKDLGAEAILIGEMSEFIVVAALEMGMPVIETLHSVSESPALLRQAKLLAERLPGLDVHFIPSGISAFGDDATAIRA